MGLDSLFERLVIAQERSAAALERLSPEGPTIVVATPIAEAGKKGRKNKATDAELNPAGKDTATEERVAVVTPAALADAVIATAQAPKAVSSFLDEEPTVAAAPATRTPEEYRKAIRQNLQQLQSLTTPEDAFNVLKTASGTEKLAEIPADKFEATLQAAIKAVEQAQKRTRAAA